MEAADNAGGEMKRMYQYEGKIVRVIDVDGRAFTGIPVAFPAGYSLHEFNRDEESIKLNDYQLFESDIAEIRVLADFAILRATETWQQAGAYYVRIQAMARKHHITLREEFDEHDTPETRYIVVTDQDFPVATARMYPLNGTEMMIGRVVVLPEYRRLGIGTMTVLECEKWAAEMGYRHSVLNSRDNKTAFYEQMGYEIRGGEVNGGTFSCVRMEKEIV